MWTQTQWIWHIDAIQARDTAMPVCMWLWCGAVILEISGRLCQYWSSASIVSVVELMPVLQAAKRQRTLQQAFGNGGGGAGAHPMMMMGVTGINGMNPLMMGGHGVMMGCATLLNLAQRLPWFLIKSDLLGAAAHGGEAATCCQLGGLGRLNCTDCTWFKIALRCAQCGVLFVGDVFVWLIGLFAYVCHS